MLTILGALLHQVAHKSNFVPLRMEGEQGYSFARKIFKLSLSQHQVNGGSNHDSLLVVKDA